MPLPPSFAKDGFLGPSLIRGKFPLKNGKYLKPVMIGTEGQSDTGKSEFLLSCPGPSQIIAVDRGIRPVLDNPNPPESRGDNFAIKIIDFPRNLAATQKEFVEYFKLGRDTFYKALANPDSVTVGLDGHSDFWEIHCLAEFGRITGIYPPVRYAKPYAEHRAIIARAFDSGKIIVATNKVKDVYETVYKADGTPEKDDMGNDRTQKSGDQKRQGFPDQDYLWDIQIRHMYKPAKLNSVTNKIDPHKWGIRILKCKVNMSLVGEDLWGDDCSFLGLMSLVYPNVDPSNWGF